jgi:antirestriction protein ArdC
MTAKVWQPLIDSMIEALENQQVTGKWKAPWVGGQHTNAATLRPYRSMNALALSVACYRKPRNHSIWATYSQWKALGMQVRKGCTGVALWTPPRALTKTDDSGEKIKTFIHSAVFYVFNADDVDGFIPPEPLPESQRLIDAEFFLHKRGANVVFSDPSSAFYSPSKDVINMPPFANFESPEGYYATLAHELVHWTGHKTRLDRNMSNTNRTEYAFEELIAEFGSAMICSHLNIESDVRADHLPYLQYWLSAIKSEPDVVRKAVVQAAKAFNYIDSNVQEQTEEQE